VTKNKNGIGKVKILAVSYHYEIDSHIKLAQGIDKTFRERITHQTTAKSLTRGAATLTLGTAARGQNMYGKSLFLS